MERLENENEITNKKIIPKSIETATIKALSFYPELKDVKIEFKFSENIRKSVMQAQPRFVSMYGTREWRTYLIKISKSFELKGEKIPIEELPEDVLVGWIGHELGHVMDYLNKNNWSLILYGIGYLTSKSFIISAERAADTYAVQHGLGDYILATKNFILNEAGMSQLYLSRIEKLYLSPEEIIALMENRQPGD